MFDRNTLNCVNTMMEKLSFRKFILVENEDDYNYHDIEVAGLYMHHDNLKVKEIAVKTGKSVSEIYRILHRTGSRPNRMNPNHMPVVSLADAGFAVQHIAELTGYTSRNVRYILHRRLTEEI